MLPWNSLHRYHFSKLPALSQVPRVVNPPPDVFHRYFVAQAAPIVFIGSPLFSGQPRSLDDIVRRDGGKIHINVRGGDYLNVHTRQQERMTLSEYIERYVRPWERDGYDIGDTGSLPRYAGNTPLAREDFEALGFRYPECFESMMFETPRLWFGPRGSLTPLHYDSRDNLICQYIGTKHLTLYPPSQIRWLYTRGFAPAWSGIADPRQPDLNKFPLFSRAKAVEVTLVAGEMLYLPARWSHFVVNLDTSLMVNFWPEPTHGQQIRGVLSRKTSRMKRRLQRAVRVLG
jgi:Cupin-like domain